VCGLKIPVSEVQFSPCPPFLLPAKPKNPQASRGDLARGRPGAPEMACDGPRRVVGSRIEIRIEVGPLTSTAARWATPHATGQEDTALRLSERWGEEKLG
jgi:hypothetical protein